MHTGRNGIFVCLILLGGQPGNLPSLKPFLACINHAYPVTPQKTDVCNQQNTYLKNARVTNQRSAPTNLQTSKIDHLNFENLFIHQKKAVCCDWLVQLWDHAVVLEDKGAKLQSLDETIGVRMIHVLRRCWQNGLVYRCYNNGEGWVSARAMEKNTLWGHLGVSNGLK